jgi:hypothetical protein
VVSSLLGECADGQQAFSTVGCSRMAVTHFLP